MFPSHFGISTDQIKVMWLGILVTDEAGKTAIPFPGRIRKLLNRHVGSHCAVALMEAFNHFFMEEGTSSPEALYHLSTTFSLVEERLKSAEALSDSTLGIIFMLVLQEQIRQGQIEAEIHFDGLKKMIELRGGLSKFE
jgi:hypothetical protein